MIKTRSDHFMRFMGGASAIALGMMPATAFAQDADETNLGDDAQVNEAGQDDEPDEAIVISGIRRSLMEAMDIKRDAQGVVDAISAEDIGKFPDTNLAESLQRITGVSIDRSSGEGSTVTVRGFGPEFNIVLLNGRQMPASNLAGSAPPSSRSFDFGNLAAEGVAAVEVYKSGRATLPTGGIGSVINIRTPRPLDRPGLQGSVAAKAVYDTSWLDGTEITPEFSGILSNTFADGRLGILVSGSYQERKGSVAEFNALWRESLRGDEGGWGQLPATAENRPQGNTVYQVPQAAGYDFNSFTRERINGQAVLQYEATDNLTATVEYTFSQNTFDNKKNRVEVWFNHGDTSSAWTDGTVTSGPLFYSEAFPVAPAKDTAFQGAVAANRSQNHSIAGTIEWEGLGGGRWELDAHHSTAESKPTSPYGSDIAVGASVLGVSNQSVDFTTDLPTINLSMYPGSERVPSNIYPSGSSFRNGYMKNEINQVALRSGYDFEDESWIDAIDFGFTFTENRARTAFGTLQTDDWGGVRLSPDQLPDEFFTLRSVNEDLTGMESGAMVDEYYDIDTVALIEFLESSVQNCSMPWTGVPSGEGCLAEYSTDRRTTEKTVAPYLMTTHGFDIGNGNRATLRLGMRYERTDVDSSALVPTPVGLAQVAQNEIAIVYGPDSSFSTLKGTYDNWLPAIDIGVEATEDIVLRASYSHTLTRPNYADLQGGLTLASPVRPDGGTGSSGNPGLLPYLSKNIDLSAEWYYDTASYASIGFFDKEVSNFISSGTTQFPAFNLPNPAAGAVLAEARAALGPTAAFSDLVAYVQANYPSLIDPTSGGVLGQAGDPSLIFTVTQPANSDQVANLSGWEFAIQHNFWDTGFGTILNYTFVNSDTKYDLSASAFSGVPQFAITGVSDSANAVLFYDKGPFQARVAYNWRDKFLGGYDLDPYFVGAYDQIDASASYEFGNGITLFVEGINITNSDRKGYRRDQQNVFFAIPGKARYAGGVRFTF